MGAAASGDGGVLWAIGAGALNSGRLGSTGGSSGDHLSSGEKCVVYINSVSKTRVAGEIVVQSCLKGYDMLAFACKSYLLITLSILLFVQTSEEIALYAI